MATTTEELQINITVNSAEAERKLEALRSRITQIAALSQQGNFQHLGELSKSIKSMASSADKLSGVAQSLQAITQHAQALGSNLASIKESKDAFNGMSRSIKNAKAALEDAESAGTKGKGFFGNLDTKSFDFAGSIVSDFKRIWNAGSKVAQLPFKMLFQPIQGLTTRVAGLTKGFGGLFHTIKRVAFMRAIRAAIRMVTQAIKEGVSAVYEWAGAVGNSFVGTMNSITTSLTYFRNSIGAAISPILDAIAPVLDAVIDKCVAVINVFNQLIATLTGASTWRKAEKVATSFGGATNNAAKGAKNANDAVKELKRTLLGFDEINRLDAPDNGSSSGGSGGGSGAGSAAAGALAFSEQKISSSVENFAQKLRDAWSKADFTEIGTIIGEKVGKALQRVPWESKIQPTAAKVARSFGTLLNGMFDYGGSGGRAMWDGIAYTIYGAINTALIARSTFFETVNWTGIGRGIGAALAKVVYNIRWDEVRKNLAAFPNAVIDAVTGFCMEMSPADFHQAGIKIGNAVAGALIDINWNDLFKNAFKMADRLVLAINGVFESFGSKWGEIKTGIINGIKSVPSEQWAKLGTDIGHLIFNVGSFVANMVDLLVKAIEAGHWGRLIGSIWQGIDDKVVSTYGGWTNAAFALGGWIVKHLGTISIALSLALAGIWLKTGVTIVKNLLKSAINSKLIGATGGISSSGWVGATLSLAATASLLFEIGMLHTDVTKQNWYDFAKRLAGGIVGAVLGFTVGGPKGAMLGFSVGAELTVNFTKVIPKFIGGLDNLLFGWYDKLIGNDRSNTDHGVSEDYYNTLNTLTNGKQPQTVTSKQNRTYGAANTGGTTYGSSMVVSFDVMPRTNNATDWWDQVAKAWDKIVETRKASRFNIMGIVNEGTSWWNQLQTFWTTVVTTRKASRFHVTGVVNEGTAWWNQLQAFWSNIVNSRKASRFHVTGVVNDASTWWSQTQTFWNNYTGRKKMYAYVAIGGLWNAFADAWNTMQRYWTNNPMTAYVNVVRTYSDSGDPHLADGGIFKNGRWQDVRKYAAGGIPGGHSGQLFIAREAGPELVGNLGGSTAVLNNTQIVDSVAMGVASAVAQVLGDGAQSPTIEVTIKADSETLYRTVKKGEKKASGRYGTAVAIG